MRRKYLALAYIAVFETILSWDKWDGAIEMIMVTLMFWGMNLALMVMSEMEEEKDDVDYKSHQKRKAPGKRRGKAYYGGSPAD